MSKLEPTRTYSNPTANDILRRMLDERGVEWEDCGNGATYVEHNGEAWRFDYDEPFDQLCIVCLSGYTPEQAIAATLGPAYEPPVAMHWNGDVLTLTIPRDPSCIRVQRSAEQPCKVYADESKVIAATLGATDAKPTQVESSGTCEADETDTWECVRDDLGGYGKTMTVHVMKCTECGHTYEHVNGDYEFCPRCGRRIEQ